MYESVLPSYVNDSIDSSIDNWKLKSVMFYGNINKKNEWRGIHVNSCINGDKLFEMSIKNNVDLR